MTDRRFFLAAGLAPLLPAQPATLQVKTLLQQAIGSISDGQAFLQIVELPPGVKSGAHRHPGPVLGYVLEGALELEIEGRPMQTVRAGEAFFEPAGVVHAGTRNPSSRESVRFVAVVLGPAGQPAVLPK